MRIHHAHAQAGAALASSMLILIVLTLLGLAAMRSSRLELRLSQNAESRVNALQSAQAIADGVTQNDANLSIQNGTSVIPCFLPPSGNDQPDRPPPDFSSCTAQTLVAPNDAALRNYTYARVQRETPEFVTTLRGTGNSSRSYDFARFSVTGGYDHSREGFGAAEVVQGVSKLHAKPKGVTYQ